MINKELKYYIEKNIFKEYSKNEEAHGLNHIKYVIKRSLNLSKDKDIDINMVYTIAAYHDIGHHIDAKNHEVVSAKILLKDEKYEKYLKELRKLLNNKEEFIKYLEKIIEEIA